MTTLRQTLDQHLLKLSSAQLNFFNKLYPDLTSLKQSSIKTAIFQCENTIKKNEQNKARLNELFTLYPNKVNEAELILGSFSSHSVIDHDLFKAYESILTQVEQVVIPKVKITDGHAKTPNKHQLQKPYFDYKKFVDEDDAKSYYKDEGSELFEVGQGLYQDQASDYCYIDDVFFRVDLKAEVWGAKQDRGDKLYHVERITDIVFSKAEEKDIIEKRKNDLEQEMQKLMNEMNNKNKEHLALTKFYDHE